MRHRVAGRKLNRNAAHRRAMSRNMLVALITHERIITTVAKAKELRPYAERIITLAKRGIAANNPTKLLHTKRLIIARLGPVAKISLVDKKDEATGQTVLNKIFELATRYADRPGGYTRILKRTTRRLGDSGETAYIELLKAGEKKVKTVKENKPVAPAPAPAPAQ